MHFLMVEILMVAGVVYVPYSLWFSWRGERSCSRWASDHRGAHWLLLPLAPIVPPLAMLDGYPWHGDAGRAYWSMPSEQRDQYDDAAAKTILTPARRRTLYGAISVVMGLLLLLIVTPIEVAALAAILIAHEGGHALAFKRYRVPIEDIGFLGIMAFVKPNKDAADAMRPNQWIIVSVAGLLGGLMPLVPFALLAWVGVDVGMALIWPFRILLWNALPIPPFDGFKVAQNFGRLQHSSPALLRSVSYGWIAVIAWLFTP